MAVEKQKHTEERKVWRLKKDASRKWAVIVRSTLRNFVSTGRWFDWHNHSSQRTPKTDTGVAKPRSVGQSLGVLRYDVTLTRRTAPLNKRRHLCYPLKGQYSAKVLTSTERLQKHILLYALGHNASSTVKEQRRSNRPRIQQRYQYQQQRNSGFLIRKT